MSCTVVYQNLNSVDFLQINFTSNILYIMATNSEEPEDAIQSERWMLQVFKSLLIFKLNARNNIIGSKENIVRTTPSETKTEKEG